MACCPEPMQHKQQPPMVHILDDPWTGASKDGPFADILATRFAQLHRLLVADHEKYMRVYRGPQSAFEPANAASSLLATPARQGPRTTRAEAATQTLHESPNGNQLHLLSFHKEVSSAFPNIFDTGNSAPRSSPRRQISSPRREISDAIVTKKHSDAMMARGGSSGSALHRCTLTGVVVKPESHESKESISDKVDKTWSYDKDFTTRHSATKRYSWLGQIAIGYAFETCFAAIVCVDIMLMALGVQVDGMETATKLGLKGYYGDTVAFVQWMQDFLHVCEYTFGALYCLELIIKILGLKWEFTKSWWNWLDFCIVGLTIFNLLASEIEVDARIAKIARIARLMRISKMTKLLKHAESFIVLARSIRASMGALSWSLMFLFILITISAMFLSQMLESFIVGEDNPESERLEVFMKYGTFARAVVTMFEVTIGNWGPVAWLLIDSVGELYLFPILMYKCTAGFAVLNVINAVFLRQTMKVADELDDYMIEEKKKAGQKYLLRLKALFQEMDVDGDGVLSKEEFDRVLASASMKAWLQLLDIQATQLHDLFDLIDDGDGSIDPDEFCRGVMRLKGGATAVDVMHLMTAIHKVDLKVDRLRGCLGFRTSEPSRQSVRAHTMKKLQSTVQNLEVLAQESLR